MIKTFRGKLTNDTEQTIRLSTKKGKIGYRIKKFQVMGINENVDYETVVQIYKVTQSTVLDTVDFTDGNLLAAALYGDATSTSTQAAWTIIFDQEIFNQDIYISTKATTGSEFINYYLELETINLTDNAAAVSTLRDIRLNPQVGG